MKKRLFAIMLALALVLAAVPALAEGEGEPDKTAKKVEKQETEQGETTRNSTPIEQNEQQQSNEAQLKSQPVKAPASPVGTGDCSAGHDWSKKDGKCVKCGFECKHDWQKVENDIIQPTCTQSGTVRLNCKICGKATRQTNADPLGHDYDDGVVTKEPTETETGIKTFTCKNCNATYTEVIPATGAEGEGTHVHVWPTTPDTIIPATCSQMGKKIYKCTVAGCDNTKEEIIPVDTNAHNYSIKGEFKTPVTCLKDGLQILECEHCGHKTVATVKAPGTHTWGAPVWAWSDNYSVATATFNCTREGCNESKTLPATVTTSNEYSNCYVYTRYTAKVTGPDEKEHSNIKTTNCRRPDWYYDPCYYNNPCGH
ncbi:MAG: hypothetical protein SPF25_06545, partial [Eubacteriales bacterium]|nr:hypothetical protein [Eubacteriales bacterium]